MSTPDAWVHCFGPPQSMDKLMQRFRPPPELPKMPDYHQHYDARHHHTPPYNHNQNQHYMNNLHHSAPPAYGHRNEETPRNQHNRRSGHDHYRNHQNGGDNRRYPGSARPSQNSHRYQPYRR